MIINKYKDETLEENRVDIFYNRESCEILELFNYLDKIDKRKNVILGENQNEKHYISIEDVFYFDSVDKKTFAYLEKDILQVKYSLKQLESLCEEFGFVRINKSQIVNIYKIKYLKADANMRIQIYLVNNETVIINRHYKKPFQKRLEDIKDKKLREE